MPRLEKKIREVGHISLTGGRINDGLDGDTEIGQSEDEDEHPEDEVKHWLKYTTTLLP